jgi:hypothetical protein
MPRRRAFIPGVAGIYCLVCKLQFQYKQLQTTGQARTVPWPQTRAHEHYEIEELVSPRELWVRATVHGSPSCAKYHRNARGVDLTRGETLVRRGALSQLLFLIGGSKPREDTPETTDVGGPNLLQSLLKVSPNGRRLGMSFRGPLLAPT